MGLCDLWHHWKTQYSSKLKTLAFYSPMQKGDAKNESEETVVANYSNYVLVFKNGRSLFC